MSTKKKTLQAAAGQAGAGAALNVESVFSTYLYTPVDNSNPTVISNGIDLDGEGGMIWIARREDFNFNQIYDSERSSFGSALRTYQTSDQSTDPGIASVSSDGFTLTAGRTSTSTADKKHASWTFRKAPKFFDVVTYTGDGTTDGSKTIAHNLDTTVGSIIIKGLSNTFDWRVWHRNDGVSPQILFLNQTYNAQNDGTVLNVTNTDFSVAHNAANQSGVEYVAYLFAHNDGDGDFGESGDQDIIKCGSYTGSTSDVSVDVGFEPQFVIVKNATYASNWLMMDVIRGMPHGDGATFVANDSTAENGTLGSDNLINPTASGFIAKLGKTQSNRNGDTHIYIAIRRPMKTPESGTEVFMPNDVDNGASAPDSLSGFPVDMYFRRYVNTTNDTYLLSRLTGTGAMKTNATDAEVSLNANSNRFDFNNGVMNIFSTNNADFHTWMFKRAPGFFDVVCYEGNGTAGRTVSHNLGVAPEMMIVKRRDGASSWITYWEPLGATKGVFIDTNAAFTSTTYWNDTAPTDSVFSLGSGSTNTSSATFIAYLFASLDGISKVGSYTGNGTSQTIDCGFSTGARFVLIKRSDSTGDWHTFDTERGIVAGNDPRLELNTTDAEDTGSDYIDPVSSGFAVTSSSLVNASGGTFIYLAIS